MGETKLKADDAEIEIGNWRYDGIFISIHEDDHWESSMIELSIPQVRMVIKMLDEAIQAEERINNDLAPW